MTETMRPDEIKSPPLLYSSVERYQIMITDGLESLLQMITPDVIYVEISACRGRRAMDDNLRNLFGKFLHK